MTLRDHARNVAGILGIAGIAATLLPITDSSRSRAVDSQDTQPSSHPSAAKGGRYRCNRQSEGQVTLASGVRRDGCRGFEGWPREAQILSDTNAILLRLLTVLGMRSNSVELWYVHSLTGLAEAGSRDGIPAIVFGPEWLKKTQPDWYALLGHELGHIVNHHASRPTDSPIEKEAEADRFAGRLMAQAGIPLDVARTTLRDLPSAASYPSPAQRALLATEGWYSGAANADRALLYCQLNKLPNVSFRAVGEPNCRATLAKGCQARVQEKLLPIERLVDGRVTDSVSQNAVTPSGSLQFRPNTRELWVTIDDVTGQLVSSGPQGAEIRAPQGVAGRCWSPETPDLRGLSTPDAARLSRASNQPHEIRLGQGLGDKKIFGCRAFSLWSRPCDELSGTVDKLGTLKLSRPVYSSEAQTYVLSAELDGVWSVVAIESL